MARRFPDCGTRAPWRCLSWASNQFAGLAPGRFRPPPRLPSGPVAASAPKPAVPAAAFTLEPYAYAEARELAQALDLAEPVAITLVRRGYRTVEQARAFLDADETHDPLEFEGMAEAVARMRAAIQAGERITVHGDYDADGVCSTSILVGALRALKADCDWYIPDRMGDGYGLTTAGVERLAERGTRLLVTVDCGITCAEEVAQARAAGIEVIVTDHHQPGEVRPDCVVIHPELSGYPCPDLCATGVAYKLSQALRGSDCRRRPGPGRPGDGRRPGAAPRREPHPRPAGPRGGAPGAASRAAGADGRGLDRARAPGRGRPLVPPGAADQRRRAPLPRRRRRRADAYRATRSAPRRSRRELDRANHERRDDRAGGAGRRRGGAARPPRGGRSRRRGLVLAGEGWHAGVVGICASRMVEQHRPPGGPDRDRCRGPRPGLGTQHPGLRPARRRCGRARSTSTRFGGHRAAAGSSSTPERSRAFREAFAAHAREVLGDGPPRPGRGDRRGGGRRRAGAATSRRSSTRLAPFGKGNPPRPADRPGRPGPRRAADGGGGPPCPLQPGGRSGPRPRGRLRRQRHRSPPRPRRARWTSR